MIAPIFTPTGKFYPTTDNDLLASVTTILSATRSKKERDRLRKWQHKMDKLHGDGAAAETSTNAKNRGDTIHKAIAATLADLYDAQKLLAPKLKPFWESVKPIIRAISKPIAVEHTVYHHALKYAGTLDLICDWNGKKTIVDWKTTDRLKKAAWMEESQMQVAAYKGAYEVMNNCEIPQSLIVVISPSRVQQFLYDSIETKPHWEAWLKRLDEYYSKR